MWNVFLGEVGCNKVLDVRKMGFENNRLGTTETEYLFIATEIPYGVAVKVVTKMHKKNRQQK